MTYLKLRAIARAKAAEKYDKHFFTTEMESGYIVGFMEGFQAFKFFIILFSLALISLVLIAFIVSWYL